jgi:methionyl-tRNA synthetase
VNDVEHLLGKLDPNRILDKVWELVRAGNRFAESQAPWNLAKDPARRPDLEATIYGLLETMRYLAVLLYPVMPEKTHEIWNQAGVQGRLEDQSLSDLKRWGGIRSGRKVRPAGPVFPRI